MLKLLQHLIILVTPIWQIFQNPIECDCLICGDDGKAKEIASDIIEKIPGLKAIDIGPLNKAHLIESITPLLIGMNIKFKSHYGGFRITGIDFE